MLVELIDLVNFVIIFLFEMTLLRWLTFLFKSLIVTVTVLFILIDFSIPIRKLLSCCFHWLSVCQNGITFSLHRLWLFSCWLGRPSWSFEECSMEGYLWTQCFNCCYWILWLRSSIYPSHCKYQVKLHSSPWISAACATAIAHRNHFFCLCKQNKFSKSKVKFAQDSNCYKRVLEAAKLAYAKKKKEKLGS